MRLCSVTFCYLLILTCFCILTIFIYFLISFISFMSLCSTTCYCNTGNFTYNLLKHSTNSNLGVFFECTATWIRQIFINFIGFYCSFKCFLSSIAVLLIFIFTQSRSSLVVIGNYVLSRWYFALWYINSISKSDWQPSCWGLHFQMLQTNFSIFSRILFSWMG